MSHFSLCALVLAARSRRESYRFHKVAAGRSTLSFSSAIARSFLLFHRLYFNLARSPRAYTTISTVISLQCPPVDSILFDYLCNGSAVLEKVESNRGGANPRVNTGVSSFFCRSSILSCCSSLPASLLPRGPHLLFSSSASLFLRLLRSSLPSSLPPPLTFVLVRHPRPWV